MGLLDLYTLGRISCPTFCASFLMGKNRSHLDSLGSSGTTAFWTKELPAVLTTFALVSVGWVFFRAESLHHAYRVFLGLISTNHVEFPLWSSFDWAWAGLYICIMIVIEFLGRNHEHPCKSTQFYFLSLVALFVLNPSCNPSLWG